MSIATETKVEQLLERVHKLEEFSEFVCKELVELKAKLAEKPVDGRPNKK